MLDSIGEFLRLYAWIALPVFMAGLLAHRLRHNHDGLVSLLPLILIWIFGRLFTITLGTSDSWPLRAGVDALGSLVFLFLAIEIGPRRPMAVISFLLAIEVAAHAAYGWHLDHHDYSKPLHRLYYWSIFTIAWGQAFVSAKWGGSRGKRQSVADVHHRHVRDLDRAGGLRLADRFFSVRGRG